MRNILMIVFLFFFPAIAFSQPTIQFDEEIHDFGTVEQGNALKHTFIFKNTGDEELVINQIKTS